MLMKKKRRLIYVKKSGLVNKNVYKQICHSLCLTLYPLELLKCYKMKMSNLGSRAHVGKFLSIQNLAMSVEMLDICEMCTRNNFEPTLRNPYSWSGPKEQQNRTDIFLSVYCVIHIIIRSKKDKGKELKEWIMRDIIPRGLNDKIKEITQ